MQTNQAIIKTQTGNSELTTSKTHSQKLTQCLASGNSMEVMTMERSLTMVNTFQGKLVRSYQPADIGKALVILIMRTANAFNVKRNINEDQATMIAGDLLDKFPTETLEDFVICFKKARQGDFGTTYEGLDSQKMFEWMGQHLESKAIERERLNRVMQANYKAAGNDANLLSHEACQRSYQEMKKGKDLKEDPEAEFRKFRASFIANRKVEDAKIIRD